MIYLLLLTMEVQAFTFQSGISRSEEQAALRLYPHFETLGISSTKNEMLRNHIIPSVFSWYSNLLKIHPISSNLVLSEVDKCGSLDIPSSHKTSGVSADVIIYIYQGSNADQSQVEGKACVLQSDDRNYPVAGYLQIDSGYYQLTKLEEGFAYISQQVARILGYDFDLIQYYTEVSPIITKEIRGKTARIISLPTVLSKAKSHFSCYTIEGLEVEDNSDKFVWESRIMKEDFMSPLEDFQVIRVTSHISAALFEDTNWFEVDYSYTSNFKWGQGKGCEFLENECIEDDQASFSEFCDQESEIKCHHSRMGFDTCDKNSFNGGYGGSQSTDTCPVVPVDSTYKFCYTNSWLVSDNCENCKCFENDLKFKFFFFTRYVSYYSLCFQYECKNSFYTVTIDNEEKDCSDGTSITFGGYMGSLQCAPFEEICGTDMCLMGCLGAGQCVDGKCQCNEGYSGIFCEYYTCHSSCNFCVGPRSDQCLECNQGVLKPIDTYYFGECGEESDDANEETEEESIDEDNGPGTDDNEEDDGGNNGGDEEDDGGNNGGNGDEEDEGNNGGNGDEEDEGNNGGNGDEEDEGNNGGNGDEEDEGNNGGNGDEEDEGNNGGNGNEEDDGQDPDQGNDEDTSGDEETGNDQDDETGSGNSNQTNAIRCHPTCAECTDNNTCSKCNDNAILNFGACECLPPYYMNVITGVCYSKEISTCHSNCLTCLDEDPNFCLTCEEGNLVKLPSRWYCHAS